MAFPGHLLRFIVPTASPEQIQPAGVDLRVDEICAISGKGFIGKSERRLPRGIAIRPENGVWILKPGAYKVAFMDIVEVPSTAIGLCLPRSSLLRMGASLFCGFWDPGYRGRGEALLLVANEEGVELEKGARIAQLVFIRVTSPGGIVYSGRYQYERLQHISNTIEQEPCRQ